MIYTFEPNPRLHVERGEKAEKSNGDACSGSCS